MFQAPKASVNMTPLHVGITNLEQNAWEKCTVTLNASAGDQAYRYALGNVPGESEQLIFLTQFTQKDGKRFLPLFTKASEVTLQCRNPGQPFHYKPESANTEGVEKL